MKKRKFNILLNIAVLCMCIAAIAIGVYSAKTASLNVSGTIGFTAHNCKVRVLGKITGAVNEKNVALDPANTPTLNYQESADTGKLIDGKADKWDFGSIYFDDLNTDKYHEVNDIVFTFTITNESDYYVDVTVKQDCIKNNRIFIYAPNNGETLAPKGTVTLTVKLKLQKVNGEYSSLDLNSAINFSDATLLKFTKSQAPSYLATDWKTQINTFNDSAFSSAKKISFLKEINDTILNGFDKDGENYKTVSVGAVNETSNAGNLTTSVTDVVAYYNSTDKEIIIYSPARIYAPQNCGKMFMFSSDTLILNTTFTSLDVSNFDTSKVTDMSLMFSNSTKLTSIDVSNFDTSNVTKMNMMFWGCRIITSLDVSNFDTSKVTDMGGMFGGCSGLTSLDVSKFDTSNVTKMNSMFGGCSITNLDVSNFNTSSVTNMSGMFQYCSALTSLDVSNFDTSNVTDMDMMFSYCSALTSLDVSNFNTGNVTKMRNMFSTCVGLTSLDVSNFDTSNVTDMDFMFDCCSALTSLDVSKFNTSSVTSMESMFISCSKLTNLDVSNFDTSKVTDMGSMFSGCSGLTSLDVSKFDTSNVTSMERMFKSCSELASLDLSNFNTSKVTYMYDMFESCSKLTSLDLSNFNTSKVTYMSSMFKSCSELKTIYVNSSEWSIANVTNHSNMFSDCTKLVGGAGTIYNSSKTDKTYARVDGGTANPGYLTAKA